MALCLDETDYSACSELSVPFGVDLTLQDRETYGRITEKARSIGKAFSDLYLGKQRVTGDLQSCATMLAAPRDLRLPVTQHATDANTIFCCALAAYIYLVRYLVQAIAFTYYACLSQRYKTF